MPESDKKRNSFIKRLEKSLPFLFSPQRFNTENSMMDTRERVSIFFISYIFALVMWALVNLGREFEINYDFPVELTSLPSDYAISKPIISTVEATLKGEGWTLLNIYNDDIRVKLEVDETQINNAVNIEDIMRKELNTYPSISILRVTPSNYELDIDKKVIKKVPVYNQVRIVPKNQYDFISNPKLYPDSVVLTGAEELLKGISFIPTEQLTIDDADKSININVNLIQASALIEMNTEEIKLLSEISEFTEGEIRVFVRSRNVPTGFQYKFDPSVITIRYDVPIEEYAKAQDIVPFTAYVDFKDLVEDTTGFVEPNIEKLAENLHLSLRSFQPSKVAYYTIINE